MLLISASRGRPPLLPHLFSILLTCLEFLHSFTIHIQCWFLSSHLGKFNMISGPPWSLPPHVVQKHLATQLNAETNVQALFFRYKYVSSQYKSWLVVSTPLKNMSQLGWWHSLYMEKIKNVPNYQPERGFTRNQLLDGLCWCPHHSWMVRQIL